MTTSGSQNQITQTEMTPLGSQSEMLNYKITSLGRQNEKIKMTTSGPRGAKIKLPDTTKDTGENTRTIRFYMIRKEVSLLQRTLP